MKELECVSTNPDRTGEDAETSRRAVHDIAATIISIRALAETLGEYLPTLVAISRSKSSVIQTQIPARQLDALPSMPAEIVELCEIASGCLKTLGKRTTVAQEVPRASLRGAPRESNPWAKGRSSRNGLSILLVEDEENVRYVTTQTLEAQGYLVASVCDGEEALRLLEKQDYDLVLMDLRIPGMSGPETAKRIRAFESGSARHTRIVGLTASPLFEDRREAMNSGMDDVLVKPIEMAVLKSMLGRFCK